MRRFLPRTLLMPVPGGVINLNSTLRYRNAAAARFRRKCLLRLGFGWSR
jgi:hypothetical protein